MTSPAHPNARRINSGLGCSESDRPWLTLSRCYDVDETLIPRPPKQIVGGLNSVTPFRRLNRAEVGGSWESKQLADMIGKVRRGIARLIDAYEDGLLQKPEFEPRVQRARERLTRLEAEAEAQAGREREHDDLRLVLDQFQVFAEQVRQGLDNADWQTRREIIRALVKRVEIGPEEARIVYRVTPRPFDLGPAPAVRLRLEVDQ